MKSKTIMIISIRDLPLNVTLRNQSSHFGAFQFRLQPSKYNLTVNLLKLMESKKKAFVRQPSLSRHLAK